MELYPVRIAHGFPEIAWSLRRWAMRFRARRWQRVTAVVEQYEFLEARENGWLVVLYSYAYGDEHFSGEFRRWLLFEWSTKETKIGRIIQQFPRGTSIPIRVNPSKPEESLAEV